MNKLAKLQQLSDTEVQIMNIIWEKDRPIKSNELLTIFSNEMGKEWKSQTISTFLSRLVDKGLLSVTKEGRANVYSAAMSLKEFEKRKAQGILDKMYNGSVKNFLSTLYDDKLTSEELDELQKWFESK